MLRFEVAPLILPRSIAHTKQEREARIKKQLKNPELPPSPYDTAWVAMVPLRDYPRAPRFPQCVEWILQNQQDDGSWGIGKFNLLDKKSILLSTLACVIALKKWNVGPEHIKRGREKDSPSGVVFLVSSTWSI